MRTLHRPPAVEVPRENVVPVVTFRQARVTLSTTAPALRVGDTVFLANVTSRGVGSWAQATRTAVRVDGVPVEHGFCGSAAGVTTHAIGSAVITELLDDHRAIPNADGTIDFLPYLAIRVYLDDTAVPSFRLTEAD